MTSLSRSPKNEYESARTPNAPPCKRTSCPNGIHLPPDSHQSPGYENSDNEPNPLTSSLRCSLFGHKSVGAILLRHPLPSQSFRRLQPKLRPHGQLTRPAAVFQNLPVRD